MFNPFRRSSFISSYFACEIHSLGSKRGAMTSLEKWWIQIKLHDKWLQTPLIQATVAVNTVSALCLLTVGRQRSWPKWLEWLEFVGLSSITTFQPLFQKMLCFTHIFHTRGSRCPASCVLVDCVRGVQLFLSMPFTIHGVGDFFFWGLQGSWYTHYSFICS